MADKANQLINKKLWSRFSQRDAIKIEIEFKRQLCKFARDNKRDLEHLDELLDQRISNNSLRLQSSTQRMCNELLDLKFKSPLNIASIIYDTMSGKILSAADDVLRNSDNPDGDMKLWACEVLTTFRVLKEKVTTIVECAKLNGWPANEMLENIKSLAR